ncbi:rhodanese-like domain-containing protein [Ramlibacter sp. RBP-2]|uniref:Rhodanese-like domain-containing protein n=1 Tax=Ramlibacter lithotrophicus TaxID=2606681 RepID=A0A7X6DJY3_9BURK|nr:rhodanese-like domain-containing protein [Ramlibacter lithotrophicus]NKE68564.1 rhodanese-like domain-containing protein [Ramlibacter lithotrophicus]
MKTAITVAAILVLACTGAASAQEADFDRFLRSFDYETRADMKIDSKRLVTLLVEKKAVLVDIRFPEETQAWKMGFGLHIPLNALPARWQELPRDKLVVVACPHKDRSALAMAYLRSKGYNARYLADGLIGLAERLRGDDAKEFLEDIR